MKLADLFQNLTLPLLLLSLLSLHYLPSFKCNIFETIKTQDTGQWLWLNGQSGRFRHQLSAVGSNQFIGIFYGKIYALKKTIRHNFLRKGGV